MPTELPQRGCGQPVRPGRAVQPEAKDGSWEWNRARGFNSNFKFADF